MAESPLPRPESVRHPELKPCPWCELLPVSNNHYAWCKGPPDSPHQLAQMPLEDWNRRAADAEVERLREAIIRACEDIETLQLGRRDAVLRLRAALGTDKAGEE